MSKASDSDPVSKAVSASGKASGNAQRKATTKAAAKAAAKATAATKKAAAKAKESVKRICPADIAHLPPEVISQLGCPKCRKAECGCRSVAVGKRCILC